MNLKNNRQKKERHPLRVWVGKFEHYEELILATKTKRRAMQLVLPKKDWGIHRLFDSYFEEYIPEGREVYLWYTLAKKEPDTVFIYRSPKLKKKKRRDHNTLLLDEKYTLDDKEGRIFTSEFDDWGVNYLDMVENPESGEKKI